MTCNIRLFGLATLLSMSMLSSGSVKAAMVYINSPLVSGVSVVSSEASAKYRLSNTNFDMSLDRGTGTAVPADFIQSNLGNNTVLNNRTFDFSLQHIAGEGFIFRMTDGMSITSTLSWGTFTTPPGGTNAATLNGELPDDSFNSIEVVARANRTNAPGSQITFSDLSFSGTGLTIADGSFFNGVITTPAGGPAAADVSQRLVADMDLSMFNWTLVGKVAGLRDTAAGGDETVRLTIGVQQVNANIQAANAVPVPASLVLLTSGGLFAGVVRLFRRKLLA